MSQSTEDISKKPPTGATLPRTETARESRIGIMLGNASAAVRRWWFQTIHRGNYRESLKTLVVVSVLTLLIWVWAETQQMVENVPISGVELKIVTSDREKFVAVRDNTAPVVTVEVTGPKTGVDKVIDELTRKVPNFQEIDLGPNLIVGSRSIAILDRIKDLPLFKQNGVSVTDVSPDYIAVEIDSMRFVTVDVLPPPEILDKVQNVVFEPAKVTVKGPASIVNNRFTVYADLENAEQLKQPGLQTIQSVRLFHRYGSGITLDPVTVQAKFEVKGDSTFSKPSMTIQIGGPQKLHEDFRVVFENERDFIHNVTFMGPKDIIDEMQKANSTLPQPYPLLILDSNDTNGQRAKRLVYVNLPKGVRVSPDDEKNEVRFHLEPRQ